MDRRKPLLATKEFFALWFLMLLPSISTAAPFPVATTTGLDFGINAAFDGTNYLLTIDGNDDAPDNIAAQFIDQSGNLVGSKIIMGHNDRMSVVAFDGTNYLVVWVDDTNYPSVLYGQFISTSRSLVGSPFLIASFDFSLSQRQDELEGVVYGGGNYLVVYDREVNSNGDSVVYGHLVSPSGTVGNEIRISSGYGHQGIHNVAFDGANFFVVWTDDGNDSEVKGRFISPAGVLGTEISINASTSPSDNPLTVAYDGANYLVVWTDEVGGIDSGEWDVFGQLVTPSGALSGGVITISAAAGQQMLPLVAFNGTNYLVTWTDMRNDANHDWACDTGEGSCLDIYGRYISKTGAQVGPEFVINNDVGNQLGGTPGFNNGKYLVLINTGVAWDGVSKNFVSGDLYGEFLGGATHNASGTYIYNAGTGVLTVTTAVSDFFCEGLPIGTEVFTIVAITTDTMTGSGDFPTWTRSPAGTANDIVGVWTFSDTGSGDTYTLTANGDGTFSLAAVLVDPEVALDTDEDGTCNNTDIDDDNDGAPDTTDAFPLDSNETLDTDNDGMGNNADTDDDADGLSDAEEAALGTNPLMADSDSDGLSDSEEVTAGRNPLVNEAVIIQIINSSSD